MKKIILSLISATFICTAFAANCVTTAQVSTGYATQTVTFKLTWTGCNATTNHLNKVWCFVDFRSSAANGTKGAWTRAAISGTPGVVNGTYSAGNTTGFYVTGTNGQSATVTVKLGNAPAMFDWCAFATDYPPNVATLSGTASTLKGSPSFVVNGSSIAGNQFTGTVNALTDATGCPGCIGRDVAIHANIPCCANLTAVGGYCRNLAADEASPFTGCNIEIKAVDAGRSLWSPNNLCPAGWRWPKASELPCMCVHQTAIGNLFSVNTVSCGSNLSCCDYWTADDAGGGYAYYMFFCNCNHYGTNALSVQPKNGNWAGVRCVR